MSGRRRRSTALTFIGLLLCSCADPAGTGSSGGIPITREEALARPNIVVMRGRADGQFRTLARDDETFDLRGYVVEYWPPAVEADLSPISIGKDAPATGTVVVGGAVIGNLPLEATWLEIKACCDAEALRLEGRGWMASFDFFAQNVEDGFAPRVVDGTEEGNVDGFLLSGAYLRHVRDDAVENDDLMSGTIRDCLFDGVNRFLSARPSEARHYSNTSSVVTIDDVLVRMEAMPNDESQDGVGHGSIFKWDESAGTVVMRDSIIYLQEMPQSSLASNAFPEGQYRNVVVVLGPGFDGTYPVELPPGVRLTRDVSVWTAARDDWLRRHPTLADPP